MRSSDRRTPVARRIEEEAQDRAAGTGSGAGESGAPCPIEASERDEQGERARDASIPPDPDSTPGPLEDALDRAALDTIPTPPPESGIVDLVAIPPLLLPDPKE
jgi:hypothetical protein